MVSRVFRRRVGPATLSLLLFLASCEYPNDAVVVENRSSRTVMLVEEFRGDRIGEDHELGPAEFVWTATSSSSPSAVTSWHVVLGLSG